jgi:hypothetical protein
LAFLNSHRFRSHTKATTVTVATLDTHCRRSNKKMRKGGTAADPSV